jgi:type IV pilus assembly protein PilW
LDHNQKTAEQGFTLVELLIAMALGLIVLASLSSAFVSQQKTYSVEEQNTEMIQTARGAMSVISREVKMVGYHWDPTFASTLQTTDSSETATYVGMLYDTTQLEIKADLDGDGNTTDDNEEIIYTEGSGTIDREEGGTTITLAENIEDFSFKYFKQDSTTGSLVEVLSSADEEQIRVIEITITAKTSKPDPNYTHPTYGDHYRRYTLTSYITPPNLNDTSGVGAMSTTPTPPAEDPEDPAEDPEDPAEDPEDPAEDPEDPAEDPEDPTGGSCALSVSILSASKVSGNNTPVQITANVSDGTGPTTGATVSYTATYPSGNKTKTDSGTLSDSGGGVYSGATGSINADDITVEVTASKDTCTDGSDSTSVP